MSTQILHVSQDFLHHSSPVCAPGAALSVLLMVLFPAEGHLPALMLRVSLCVGLSSLVSACEFCPCWSPPSPQLRESSRLCFSCPSLRCSQEALSRYQWSIILRLTVFVFLSSRFTILSHHCPGYENCFFVV